MFDEVWFGYHWVGWLVGWLVDGRPLHERLPMSMEMGSQAPTTQQTV